MKSCLFFIALLLTGHIWADDICKRVWDEMDKEEKMSEHLSETCRLESKDKKKGVQVVLYKDKCKRFDHTKEGDCVTVRECGMSYDRARISSPLYDDDNFLKGFCPKDKKKNYDLLDTDPNGISAYIDCQSQPQIEIKKRKIILKVDDQTKTCKIPLN